MGIIMGQSWENNTNSGNNTAKNQYWEYRLVTMDILIELIVPIMLGIMEAIIPIIPIVVGIMG